MRTSKTVFYEARTPSWSQPRLLDGSTANYYSGELLPGTLATAAVRYTMSKLLQLNFGQVQASHYIGSLPAYVRDTTVQFNFKGKK